MSEELKPCPQCGSKVKKRMRQYFYDCVNCEMELYDDYKLWWIWKELEKKDKLCRELLGKLWFVHAEINCSGDCTTVDLIKRAEEILK